MPEQSSERVEVTRIIHIIHAVEDIARGRALYLDHLAGLIFAEGYFEAEDRDMALLYAADFMIEPMAPRNPADQSKPFARYLHRYGHSLHSFEIQIADGPAASARLREAGCKLATDYGYFFFVRQESTGGILVEACDIDMRNDPALRPNWRGNLSEGHPSTLLRLDHIACVTPSLDEALHFFTGLLDGEIVSDERIEAPQPGRRVMLELGGTRFAFIQPDDGDSGPLGRFLQPPSSGIYAMVWQVGDEAAARAAFTAGELPLTEEGCVSPGFAIDPAAFMGARHEFFAPKG